jgi:hypothetical protein
MLLHMSMDLSDRTSVDATVTLLLPDGTSMDCRDRRLKEGPMQVFGDAFRSYLGTHGVAVLEFAVLRKVSAFTLFVNEQPLLPVNLRRAIYRSF